MGANKTFKIPAQNLEALRAKIAELAKRAAKIAKKGNLLDATTIGLEVGERVLEPSEVVVGSVCENGVGTKLYAPPSVYFICTVTGTTPKLAGWSFIATLQHEEGGTILRQVPTASYPEGTLNRFRQAGPACEHCNYNRRRNDTFVVRHDDGAVKQVGRNCLADFTGIKSPEALAALAELLAAAGEAAELSEGGGFGGGVVTEDIGAYLAYVAVVIRSKGWVSRTKAREEGRDYAATADVAWNWMHPGIATSAAVPEPRDIELAKTALTWSDTHLTEADPNTLGDYEHNLRVAMVGGIVTHRLAGIVASLISYYERAQGKILRAKAAESIKDAANKAGYVGTVGKRCNFKASLVAVFDFTSNYGVVHVHKFLTPEGAVLVWKTGTDKLDLGSYEVVGSVKEHAEYKGELQTVITRCKATKLAVVAS